VITETLGSGVMSSAIFRETNTNFVGLLGRPDGDKRNEFISSTFNIVNATTEGGIFTPEQTEEIFYNFGQTWMIRSEIDSLFNEDFFDYYLPDFTPWFEVPSVITRQLQSPRPQPQKKARKIPPLSIERELHHERKRATMYLKRAGAAVNETNAEEVCGDVEDDFIRQACIFDFAVKGDADLVAATTKIAIDRERENTILRNNPPEILDEGRNQNSQVTINEDSIFEVFTRDTDGDNITASIERNDDNLFQLSSHKSGDFRRLSHQKSTVFRLYFTGSERPGYFKAQIIVTDGITPVLVTGAINVTQTSPPSPFTKKPSEKFSNKNDKKSSKNSSKKSKKYPKKIKKSSKKSYKSFN